MIKEFSQNRSNVILNFSLKYCKTADDLLDSRGFAVVLQKHVENLKQDELLLYDRLCDVFQSDQLEKEFKRLFKLLMLMSKREIVKVNKDYQRIFRHTDDLVEFIEGLYNYWRSLERYALIETNHSESGIQNVNFIDAKNDFTKLVLKVYRQIEETILDHEHNIYRQLSAGINAGIVLNENGITLPEEYKSINDVKVIKKIVFTPPFIIYPKLNKRSGLFQEVFDNPMTFSDVNPSHFFCYPAKVGGSLAFIYFHRNFMNHGVSLCNLFQLAEPHEYNRKKPDLIYLFGGRLDTDEKRTVFYHDKKNDIHVGFASNTDAVDYFGYMKKMILTLHNVRMIKQRKLPIHGAMVNITLKDGLSKNIAIIGDSGAGKSESLEAFRKLSKQYLKEIKIIFDDMGSFHIENGKVYGYGTEIGAFVRLDDLEMGYSFNQMDRAIFMNPHRQNARLLLPVSTYETIMKGYKVDILLYANNFEITDDVLQFFDSADDAVDVFVRGQRKAKGTTSESGIVESFFANPFGCVQKHDETLDIIHKVFNKLFEQNVPVGQIFTKLAIPNFEQKGPEEAAKELFNWLKQNR